MARSESVFLLPVIAFTQLRLVRYGTRDHLELMNWMVDEARTEHVKEARTMVRSFRGTDQRVQHRVRAARMADAAIVGNQRAPLDVPLVVRRV